GELGKLSIDTPNTIQNGRQQLKASTTVPSTGSVVTWRSIFIALLLIPPNVFWVIETECIWHSGHPTTISLFWNVVLNLFFLILINLGIKQVSPKSALSQAEFITIYTMLSIASGLAGHDTLALTIPALPHAFWFATPENDWADLIHPYIPEFLVVSDKEILRGIYDGETPFYNRRIMGAWVGSTLWWTSFIIATSTIMICLNVIVRKQWTEHEKLAYPIIQLPMAITERGGAAGFFRNRLLWYGFVVAALINVWHGLAYFFPSLPDFSVRHNARDWGKFFTDRPWNAMGGIPVPLYPFVIALGFFLPLDLSFSLWFFYLFSKIQRVVGSTLGIPGPFPYLSEQSIGGWLAIFIMAVMVTRRHLANVCRTILGHAGSIDDSQEPISYRASLLLIIISGFYILWFTLKAGMTFWIIIPYFLFFYALSVGITRVRAEIGPPAHEMAGMCNGQQFLINLLGTRPLGGRNLGFITLNWWMSGRGYREHIMPHQLESFKMAERASMNTKKLVFAMLLAVIWGSLVTFWATLSELYRLGGAITGAGGGIGPSIGHIGQFNWLSGLLNFPREPDLPATGAMAGGVGFTFFLMVMRSRFMWFPLHPAGYAISLTGGVGYFWSCLVIANVLKWLTLQFGGAGSYRKAIMLMFGIMLGEYVVGAFWSVLSVVIQQPI
ncbi:MAG: hypothetical protein QGG39_05930, partial [Candidatus Poribacteria bacterium]|nr:hypothetical protein [Candidatus Poribacteria bacterium]